MKMNVQRLVREGVLQSVLVLVHQVVVILVPPLVLTIALRHVRETVQAVAVLRVLLLVKMIAKHLAQVDVRRDVLQLVQEDAKLDVQEIAKVHVQADAIQNVQHRVVTIVQAHVLQAVNMVVQNHVVITVIRLVIVDVNQDVTILVKCIAIPRVREVARPRVQHIAAGQHVWVHVLVLVEAG